jgi:hypothetical protein
MSVRMRPRIQRINHQPDLAGYQKILTRIILRLSPPECLYQSSEPNRTDGS